MYKKPNYSNTGLKVNQSSEGESIEIKVRRILQNKEPIKDGAPIIYTERKDGVQAGYNVRTDRFEVALEASDKIASSIQAKREEKAKVIPLNPSGDDSGAKSTQGTE